MEVGVRISVQNQPVIPGVSQSLESGDSLSDCVERVLAVLGRRTRARRLIFRRVSSYAGEPDQLTGNYMVFFPYIHV
jgi:hypothetical protein